MTYEEFEWHLLRMVYEEGATRFNPSYLGYSLKLPHDVISGYLDQAMDAGILEPLASSTGAVEYVVPGAEHQDELPIPIWKQQQVTPVEEAPPEPAPEQQPKAVTSVSGEDALTSAVVRGSSSPKSTTLNAPESLGHGHRPNSPPSFRTHIKRQEGQTDGSVSNSGVVQAKDVRIDRKMIVARGVSVEDSAAEVATQPVTGSASQALVLAGRKHGELMNVESTPETFCDPTRTVFMRKIRVHGVKSEQALRHQIHHLFESFGYKSVREDQNRIRFERGSVGFILALVPLFVLVIPLFVYLFFYGMGRSTIQQEPLELDVFLRKSPEDDTTYDIDLTFIGQHGIVLGAADQRVLNQEIDTLKDELGWALAAS